MFTVSLEKLYTIKIGRYSKINVDHKKGSVDYHILRNLAELQLSAKDLELLKNNSNASREELHKLIQSKKNQLLQDIFQTLPDVINELYSSGKIQYVNTIEFNSYLLMIEEIYQAVHTTLQRSFPHVEIIEMPKKPIGILPGIGLRAQDIKLRMVRYTMPRDTWYKKILSPIVTSEKFFIQALSCIFTYGGLLVPVVGRTKKDFKYTRGIQI